jgi:conjugal transfer pilus assembly protein TraD
MSEHRSLPAIPRSALVAAAAVATLVLPPSAAIPLLLLVLATRAALLAGKRLRARSTASTLTASAASDANAPDAITIGHNPAGQRVVVREQDLRAHGLILGASGSGKSTTMLTLLSAEIERGRPVVAIDLKGSPAFVDSLRQAAAAANRPFSVWSPDGPTHWNPLAAGNPTELKDKLIATERFTEPHYQRAAERYVQTALQVLAAQSPQQPPSLAQVVELLEPQRLAAAARALPQERADQLRSYLHGMTPDQNSAVRGLGSRLAILTESHTGEYLEPGPNAVDLRRALDSDEVVVFSLNSSTYGRLAAQLGTLAVQDLITATGARQSAASADEDPSLALVAIDEFSALDSSNVINLLARGREAGVGVLLATQELADLDRAARGLRDQVIGNTKVKIAHRQDVPESAATVARLAGTYKQWERSYTIEPDPLGGAVRRVTNRLVDTFRAPPETVRSQRTGEAIVIRSGSGEAQLTKISRQQRAVGRCSPVSEQRHIPPER